MTQEPRRRKRPTEGPGGFRRIQDPKEPRRPGEPAQAYPLPPRPALGLPCRSASRHGMRTQRNARP